MSPQDTRWLSRLNEKGMSLYLGEEERNGFFFEVMKYGFKGTLQTTL